METLYLLKNVCHDPLALSRFSQFRCYRLGKGKVVPDLNANDEFLVCFVLKGSLCYVLNEKDFSSRMVMENELFFVSRLHHCKVKAMDDVLLAVHACNMVAPYFHRRVIAYLKEISMEEVDPLENRQSVERRKLINQLMYEENVPIFVARCEHIQRLRSRTA